MHISHVIIPISLVLFVPYYWFYFDILPILPEKGSVRKSHHNADCILCPGFKVSGSGFKVSGSSVRAFDMGSICSSCQRKIGRGMPTKSTHRPKYLGSSRAPHCSEPPNPHTCQGARVAFKSFQADKVLQIPLFYYVLVATGSMEFFRSMVPCH